MKKKESASKSLVVVKDGEIVISSLDVADGLSIKHHSLLTLIKKYENELKEIGFLEFQIQEKRGTQGAPTKFCYLDEFQVMFLINMKRPSQTILTSKTPA